MASVMVSIAMRNHHAYAISAFLLWVAGIAYTVLVVLPGYVVPWSAVLGHSRFPVGQYANGI